jgi:hypothetical protein
VSPDILVHALVWIIGVVFGSGVAYAGLRQVRKDLNAIGGKQRRLEKNLVLVLLAITEKREDRIYIAQFLKDP